MSAMVRSNALMGYSALMRELGADARPLIRRHGLPADLGENEDALVPVLPVVQLLEESAQRTGCEDFGLQLAARQDIRILGPLAAAIQHSSTIAEAMNTVSRYLFVQSPALLFDVVQPSSLVAKAVELRIDLVLPGAPVRRQVMDQCLGDLHRVLQFLAGTAYEILAVTLPHTPTAKLRRYEQFFGARVHVDQEHGGIHVSPRTLSGSLGAVNTSLRRMALEYMNRHYADPNQSMVDRVRRALNSTLSSTQGSKQAIADLLFLHPRTLQRKLAREGAHFETLRDEVRRQTALHFLRDTAMPLAQLASVLGLADQSVLTRSCRRWFGATPTGVRGGATAAPASA
jgi:AraC-like DNA-binding protein